MSLLVRKEFELLVKLASDANRVFTKEELLRDVWGFRSIGRTRTSTPTRRGCAASWPATAPTPYVVNEWGVGYRLLDDDRAST